MHWTDAKNRDYMSEEDRTVRTPSLVTIPCAVRRIKQLNKNCYATESMLRTAVNQGRLWHLQTGNRVLIDWESTLEYLMPKTGRDIDGSDS
jgi:hypothetical protein